MTRSRTVLSAALLAAALLTTAPQAVAQRVAFGSVSHQGGPWRPNARPSSSSARLPETSRLDSDLQRTQHELNALSSRLMSIERSIETSRKRAQDVDSMIKSLGRLDDKVKRIKRELDSVARIPQLRVVKPLAGMLGTVRNQLHGVRVKADRANRDHVRPLIARLRKAEQKVEAKGREVRGLASQTLQARNKLQELRSFVASRGDKRLEVSALESMAAAVRPTVDPARRVVSQTNQKLAGVDRGFAALAQQLGGIAVARNAVTKLDRDLAKADKAARDLDRVLSKKISITFPKRFSISVRQLLEAPGKVIDIVLKPLMKLAEKALKPVLGKFKIKVSVPREITALAGQLNKLPSLAAGANAPIAKIDAALRQPIPQPFKNKLNTLLRTSASQLTRR